MQLLTHTTHVISQHAQGPCTTHVTRTMTLLPNARRPTTRQIVLYALAGGTTAYCIYKLYHSERLRAIQRRCSTTLSSLGQILKLLDTLAELSVPANDALRDVMQTSSQPLDGVLQAATSQRGQTVLSLAISVGARSLVDAVADQWRTPASTAPRPPAEYLDAFFSALSTPSGMHVMSVALSVFTTRAVDTWVRASEEVDVWDELLRAMSRPAHRRVVHEMTEIFTRTAATTLVDSMTRPAAQRCVSMHTHVTRPPTLECPQQQQQHPAACAAPRVPTTQPWSATCMGRQQQRRGRIGFKQLRAGVRPCGHAICGAERGAEACEAGCDGCKPSCTACGRDLRCVQGGGAGLAGGGAALAEGARAGGGGARACAGAVQQACGWCCTQRCFAFLTVFFTKDTCKRLTTSIWSYGFNATSARFVIV